MKIIKEVKYSRPNPSNFKMGVCSRSVEFADVIEKHLKIRLKEETKLLINCCRKQKAEEYVEWFNETEKRNSSLIAKEVSRLTSKRNPIDFYSEEGKFLIGKSLLDKFILTKRNEVIDLRKTLRLEYSRFSNKNIILTNGIEQSDIFRLFGCPLKLEELKSNYRELAKKCHPDAGGNDDLMSRVSGLYNKLVDAWDEKYNPANLGLEQDELSKILSVKFKDPDLILLLDFWSELA